MNFLWWLLGVIVALILCPFTGMPQGEPTSTAPVYTCDSLTISRIDAEEVNGIKGAAYQFTTDATVMNGAEIVSYTYDFGDGITATGGRTVDYVYPRTGTYTATVKVNVRVAGDTKPVTSRSCQTPVTVIDTP